MKQEGLEMLAALNQQWRCRGDGGVYSVNKKCHGFPT